MIPYSLFYNRVSARDFRSTHLFLCYGQPKFTEVCKDYYGQNPDLSESTISEDGLKGHDEKGSEHVEQLVTVV